MSGDAANAHEDAAAIAEKAEHKSSESTAKPNGEVEVEKNVNESPAKKATPKKAAKVKNETETEKHGTPKHEASDEKPQSAAKAKAKPERKAAAGTTSAVASPALNESKRERKKIDRFEDRAAQEEETRSRKSEVVLSKSGVSLGEIERVAHFIQRAEFDGLKLLHGIIYSRPGSTKEVRTNLRQFRGFSFDTESSEYKSRLARLKERHLKELKNACFALSLERSGSRDELSSRIMQFLIKPVDSGKPAPAPASAKKRKSAGSKGSSGKKSSSGAAKKKKEEASEDEKATESDKSESEEQDAAEDEEEDAEEEEEDEAPAKRPKASAKASKAAAPKGKSSKAKAEPKAKAAPKGKAAAKKRKADASESESSNSLSTSNSEEAKASSSKKARSDKEQPKAPDDANPSEAQLESAVESILSDADLNMTTMKVVLEKICLRFPNMEVTPSRKSFVRRKVRELIAAKSDTPGADADADAEVKLASGSTSAASSPIKIPDTGRPAPGSAEKK